MPIVEFNNFGGQIPKVAAERLPPGTAQTANNVRFFDGSLQPQQANQLVRSLQTAILDILTIYKYTPSIWLEFTEDTDVLPSINPDDPFDRVYFTNSQGPRVTDNTRISVTPPYPTASLKLGVPIPTTAPTVALTGVPDDPTSDPSTRFYLVTYTNSYGEEGPNSPVSAPIDVKVGETVTLSNLPAAPVGAYDVTHINIYRSATGSETSGFLFVETLAIGTASYVDAKLDEELAEELSTAEFDEPNIATRGLTSMPAGFFAGFFGNVVCFSEPGFPYAWPVKYRVTLDYDVVGMKVFGNTLVVITTGQPYYIQGAFPGSMVPIKMETNLSGASKRGIIDMGTFILYSSPDGLVLADSTGVKLITKGLFTRAQWQELQPASMECLQWEDRCLVYGVDTQAAPYCFSLDPLNLVEGITYHSFQPVCGFYDLEADELHVVDATRNQYIWEHPDAALLSANWKSRVIRLQVPHNFGAVQVFADKYPVDIVIEADNGKSTTALTITSNLPRRLPSGFTARDWTLQFPTLSTRINQALIADTMTDLGKV